jgi:signal transduction histidine kinase
VGTSDLRTWGGLIGLVVCLAVGVPVLVDQLVGDGGIVDGPHLVWWLAYGGYLGALVVSSTTMGEPGLARERAPAVARAALGAQVLCGAVAVAVTPRAGWTVILLVVNVGLGAYLLRPVLLASLVAVQTVLIGGLAARLSDELLEVGVYVGIYFTLQAWAAVGTLFEVRETQAKLRLAEANAELQAATALLEQSSRTRERLRIARELHDLVGHQLSALALELEVASHRVVPPASEHVARARRIAKDLLGDVRAAVGNLREPAPELRAALDALTAELPRPQVHLDVDAEVELDGDRTLALVRCVQELVTNTVRHSGAENLWVRIACRSVAAAPSVAVGAVDAGDGGPASPVPPPVAVRDATLVVLDARDDGPGAPRLTLGNGLTGMRERIEQLGGTVRFDPGPGFQVEAQVPVA